MVFGVAVGKVWNTGVTVMVAVGARETRGVVLMVTAGKVSRTLCTPRLSTTWTVAALVRGTAVGAAG